MELGKVILIDNDCESQFSEPKTFKINALPVLEDYKPTKTDIEQLPQKAKHIKKIKFHN